MDYERMLTKGALRSIKNDERVQCPVMQVIDIENVSKKRVYNNNNIIVKGYNLSVSDGENIMNSVEMNIGLNSMVSTRELSKFSIIKINRYMITNSVEPAKQPRKAIIFTDLVVVVPGSIVFKTIGNPQPIINNIEPMLKTDASVRMVQAYEESRVLHAKHQIWRSIIETGQYLRLLSPGALQFIVKNLEVKYPVMQVLGIKQVTDYLGTNRYRLMISDGQHYSSLVMLATQLNNMITKGYLNKFSIIYIRSYAVTQLSPTNKKIILLSDLICLTGCLDRMIGDPKPIVEYSGQVVENSIPASTDEIPEPSVEMDTSAPPTSPIDLDQEVVNLPLNLDMLHIF